MDKLRCYYVYELVDPRGGAVFYVGKGKGHRVSQHVVEAKSGSLRNPFKLERIRDILRTGHKVIERKVVSGLSEQEAFTAERSHIAKYGIATLTNITAGTETAAERAKVLLSRVKPFRDWMDERPRSLADRDWYHLIVRGLQVEAGLAERVS
jgi:hypothetical protein